MTRQFSPHCLAQSDCQWIYKVQSGGSHTSLNIDVGENCKVVFTTQEYPKVGRNKAVRYPSETKQINIY